MNYIDFIQRCIQLCYKYQGSIASWGRTVKHNKDVGGFENSYHILWLGCDIVLDIMTKNFEFERDSNLLGLKAILEGDHYHLQPLNFAL